MAKSTKSQTSPKSDKVATGPTTVPNWKNDEGRVVKVSRKLFPRTHEGRTAFCQYMVELWTQKKSLVRAGSDPKAKLLAKLDALKAKIAELEQAEAEDTGKSSKK